MVNSIISGYSGIVMINLKYFIWMTKRIATCVYTPLQTKI